MNMAKPCMVALTVLLLLSAAWAEQDKEEPPLRLEFGLVDGSRVIGVPDIKSLPVQTSYANMEIPLEAILAVKIGDDHEMGSFDLRNGDKIKGAVSLDAITIETVFGAASVSIEHIKAINFILPGAALPEALNEGLMLYYAFDRDEGGKVTDQSGNGHTGVVYGATHTPQGRQGGAFSFDGIDDHILGGSLGPLPTGTICFWMYPEELANWWNALATDYASGDDCFRFEINAAGEFVFGALGFGSTPFTRELNAKRWYHVALVWDGEATRGYLDGGLAFTVPYAHPAASVHPQIARNAGALREQTVQMSNISVGNGYSTAPERQWKGFVDEVRIYGRVLSARDVAALADPRSTASPKETTPLSIKTPPYIDLRSRTSSDSMPSME